MVVDRALRGAHKRVRSRRPHPMRLLWFLCVVGGLLLLGSFAYGMLRSARGYPRRKASTPH
jgi:hypothetical protein